MENLGHMKEIFECEANSWKSSEFCEKTYQDIITTAKTTYDSLAEVYDHFYPPIQLDTNPLLSMLHNLLRSQNVDMLLDCACGTGRELIPLAQTGCYNHVVGTDLSAGMLKRASDKAKESGIRWIQSEWLELPEKVGAGPFDAIICLGNPFAHIPCWAYGRVLSAMSSVLQPGGILVLNRRNWEAELGETAFKRLPPKTTVYAPVPRLSFLNLESEGHSERMAYFSYHHHTLSGRLQLLHLTEVNSDGSFSERTFSFRCFRVRIDALTQAIVDVGLRQDFQIGQQFEGIDFDSYAEEEFICLRSLV